MCDLLNPSSFLIALLLGAATGVLSGLGGGGGTILIIFMTLFMNTPQLEAQGINLLYFICAGIPAAYMYKKSGQVNVRNSIAAITAGGLCAAVSSLIASKINVGTLRTCFGVLLLVLGVRELFCSARHTGLIRKIIFAPDEAQDNPDNSAK